MQEINATDAAALLGTHPDNTLLLDVREDVELKLAAVDGTLHIPMGQVPDRVGEIDGDKHVIVMCRSGGRSAQVVEFLSSSGFGQVSNLAGGILAWSEDVDPSIPQY